MANPNLFEEETIPTFEELMDDLTDEEIELLSQHTERVEFVSGETIFYENQPAESIYIIQTGSVEISKLSNGKDDEYVPFVTLTTGNIFGEMSFLMKTETNASAVARQPTTLYRIKREDFDEIVEEYPKLGCKLYQGICQILVYRLRRTDEKLASIAPELETETESSMQ